MTTPDREQREQIRRDAARVIERTDDTYTEWAEHCLALLEALEQAEKYLRERDETHRRPSECAHTNLWMCESVPSGEIWWCDDCGTLATELADLRQTDTALRQHLRQAEARAEHAERERDEALAQLEARETDQ